MMSEPTYLPEPDAPGPIANVEAEAALLGALLTKNALFDIAVEHVSIDDFFEPVHQRIYAAIQDRLALGQVASPITLRPLFADDPAIVELGGIGYLATIATTGGGGAAVAVRDFARQVNDLARTRDLHERASAVLRDIADTRKGINPAKHAAALEAIAFDASATKNDRAAIFTASESITRVVERVKRIQESGEPTGAIAASMPELTKVVGPIERKHFHVWAGRPGMGKSALVCGSALSMAMGDMTIAPAERKQYGVGVVSLEMGDIDLGQRFAADLAHMLFPEEGLNHALIRDAKLTDRQLRVLAHCAKGIETLPLKLADVAGITMSRLSMIARRMKRELEAGGFTLDVLVVDYLQLLNGDGRYENKTAEITAISQGLKRLAKELDCGVVGLSQLSRAVEQREVKVPQLSDLRESGSIEQDADTVCFLYREHYYLQHREPDRETKPRDWEAWDIAMQACRHQLDLIVPKRRGGAAGRDVLTWIPEHQAIRARNFYSSNAGALFDAGQ